MIFVEGGLPPPHLHEIGLTASLSFWLVVFKLVSQHRSIPVELFGANSNRLKDVVS